MKVWNYIERHHESFGNALFVIPACLAGLGAVEMILVIRWMLS